MSDTQLDNETPCETETLAPEGRTKSPNRKIELLLGLGVAFVLAVMAVPGVKPVPEPEPLNRTVRSLEGLMVLARDEAVQTGEDHMIVFERSLVMGEGAEPAVSSLVARLIRDRNGNGSASSFETMESLPLEPQSGLGWGSSLATRPADGDPAKSLSGETIFDQFGSEVPQHALVFGADGAPHSVSLPSGLRGAAGSGAGAVYLHSASRDYAVVLSPWGDIDLQVWNQASSEWQLAPSR